MNGCDSNPCYEGPNVETQISLVIIKKVLKSKTIPHAFDISIMTKDIIPHYLFLDHRLILAEQYNGKPNSVFTCVINMEICLRFKKK